MRQLRLLALLAPVLVLLPAACEDPSSSTSPPFTFEAGPGFEAGPPGEAGPIPDAGGVDAADVFVPPAPKGVTVTVVDTVLARANVRVISHDATGAVIGDQKTDASGKVTMATAPSMVTVLATSNSQPTPVSFFAVTDGDNLVVRIPDVTIDQAAIGQYSVTFTPPAVAPIPTAIVVAGNGCGGNTTDTSMPILVNVFATCVGAANAILADGSDGNGLRAGFAFKKGVAPPAAPTPAVGVMLGAWTAPGTTTLTASHTPSGAASNVGSLFMIANGESFPAADLSGSITSGGQSFATATGFADAYQSVVRSRDDVADQVESSILRRESTAALTPVTLADFDFTSSLPYITGTAVDTTTAARPIVSLTIDVPAPPAPPITVADGGVVTLTWITGGVTAQTQAIWTFVVPASAAATFKAPALPTDADALTFTPTGAVNVERAAFFEATQIPSYKETKLIPITPRATPDLIAGSVPLPTNGTVRFTTWAPQPL